MSAGEKVKRVRTASLISIQYKKSADRKKMRQSVLTYAATVRVMYHMDSL